MSTTTAVQPIQQSSLLQQQPSLLQQQSSLQQQSLQQQQQQQPYYPKYNQMNQSLISNSFHPDGTGSMNQHLSPSIGNGNADFPYVYSDDYAHL